MNVLLSLLLCRWRRLGAAVYAAPLEHDVASMADVCRFLLREPPDFFTNSFFSTENFEEGKDEILRKVDFTCCG